jgi:hypothetical protein
MIFTNEVPSTKMTWKYVYGEFLELLNEIQKRNWIGILDEACDVYTCSMCAIARYTRIPMPIFWMRSANTWKRRTSWWKTYLGLMGLEFKVEYLQEGSNYNNPEKRKRVVELAIEDQIKQVRG